MSHQVYIKVRIKIILKIFNMISFFLLIAIQTIDWSDALTQFRNNRLWGDYPTSKLFQILSSYKLKQNLLSGR